MRDASMGESKMQDNRTEVLQLALERARTLTPDSYEEFYRSHQEKGLTWDDSLVEEIVYKPALTEEEEILVRLDGGTVFLTSDARQRSLCVQYPMHRYGQGPLCNVIHKSGFGCTRPNNHKGLHAAYTGQSIIIAIW